MEKLNQRKEKLAANEKLLAQSLHNYDKYLRENDIRRKRALQKVQQLRHYFDPLSFARSHQRRHHSAGSRGQCYILDVSC